MIWTCDDATWLTISEGQHIVSTYALIIEEYSKILSEAIEEWLSNLS